MNDRPATSSSGTDNTSICLSMIVKNERHVMDRLIRQVAPHLTYWVIVDTGSTDGTQAFIRDRFAELGIPGELHQRPWRDFGHNRSEALNLARGHAEYIWVIDADDIIHGDLRFAGLTADCYSLLFRGAMDYWRPQVFRSTLPWRYVGVLHEYPECDLPHSAERLVGNYHLESGRTGARSQDPDKYRKDAGVLEQAVREQPDNARYWYYLGQSWMDAGEPEKAIGAFRTRVALGGWPEEAYCAQLRLGRCLMRLNAPRAEITEALLGAHQIRPKRAEALYELARFHRLQKSYECATLFAREAAAIPLPDEDILFVEHDVYRYKALDELAVSAFYSHRHKQEGYRACRALLTLDGLPTDVRQRMVEAEQFYAAIGLCD